MPRAFAGVMAEHDDLKGTVRLLEPDCVAVGRPEGGSGVDTGPDGSNAQPAVSIIHSISPMGHRTVVGNRVVGHRVTYTHRQLIVTGSALLDRRRRRA